MVLWRLQGNLADPSANCRLRDYDCGRRSGESNLARQCRTEKSLAERIGAKVSVAVVGDAPSCHRGDCGVVLNDPVPRDGASGCAAPLFLREIGYMVSVEHVSEADLERYAMRTPATEVESLERAPSDL